MLHRVIFIMPIALTGLLFVPAASGHAELPAPIYSPWTKRCHKDKDQTCFITSGKAVIRGDCALISGAALREHAKDTKKTLTVDFPPGVNTDHGVRIIIDQAQPIIRPFERCYAKMGCTAEYEAGAELVEQLKQGRMLTVEAVDKADTPISLSLPLAGFAAAYDGPAQSVPGAPVRAQHEPTEDERKRRCEGM
jgi:invasion protein IalB